MVCAGSIDTVFYVGLGVTVCPLENDHVQPVLWITFALVHMIESEVLIESASWC